MRRRTDLRQKARILAAIIAGLAPAVSRPAQAAPPEKLPPAVAQYIAGLDQICRAAGGIPGDPMTAVKLIDLTQDGIGDYLVNGATYGCRGADEALADSRLRTPIAIFVTMPQASASKPAVRMTEKAASKTATTAHGKAAGTYVIKAFETSAYGLTLQANGLYPRLLIQQAAADCAAIGPVQQPLNEIKFCAWPLDWSTEKQSFILAPAAEAPPVQ